MIRFRDVTRRDMLLTLLIVLCSALFVAGHDLVSQIYGKLIFGLDKKNVENGMFWCALLFGVGGGALVSVRRGKDVCFWVEGGLLGVLVWLSSSLLICTNIEWVHYPQYGILGFLLRSLINDDLVALLYCNLLGMLDEFIQYVLNPHYTKYLDLNDMILNLIGALIGIVLWRWIHGGRPNNLLLPFWRRTIGACYAGLAVVTSWAAVSGRVVSYWQVTDIPDTAFQQIGDKTVLVLSYVDTTSFYLSTGLGRKYHVMNEPEWFWSSLALFALAGGLAYCGRRCMEKRLS